MKRYQVKYLLMAVMTLCLFSVAGLAGCQFPDNPRMDKNNPAIETDYFCVQLRREDGYAVVFELTDLGKEQEILAIPDYVEGLPVRQLGWDKGYNKNGLKSENLKKVYIPYTVDYITRAAFSGKGWEGIFLPQTLRKHENTFGSVLYQNGKICLTKELFGFVFGEDRALAAPYYLPNMIYYYNYSESPNSGYHWIDRITGDNLYIEPNEPKRENHIFTGWYLEPECANLWDGIMPKALEQELKVYAGWRKNNIE